MRIPIGRIWFRGTNKLVVETTQPPQFSGSSLWQNSRRTDLEIRQETHPADYDRVLSYLQANAD